MNEHIDHYRAVCDQLHVAHCKAADDPEATLNRVFGKALRLRNVRPATTIRLGRNNVRVTLERRKTEALAKLMTRDTPKRFKKKRFADVPVVIAVVGRREYLMDGNRRIHHWASEGVPTMQAYVVSIL